MYGHSLDDLNSIEDPWKMKRFQSVDAKVP